VAARPQERVQLDDAETMVLIRRALSYVAPFRRDVIIKCGLVALSLLPTLLLPWPLKIVIDHVVGDTAIGKEIRPYPFFIQPFVDALAGASKLEIVIAAVLFELVGLFLLGAFGTSQGERDILDSRMASGQDTATRTENEASWGFSWASGLLGWYEYCFTMRLSQRINHHYRSRLYERLQSLPMTTFDDERIGDAVYRVMYDTPALTQVCYRLLVTPIASPLNIVLTISVLAAVYGTASPVVFYAILFLPLVLIVTWPFARLIRARAAVSRTTGATTTATVEEGLSNIAAVQSLGGNARERRRFDQDSRESFRAFRHQMLFGLGAIVTGAVFGALLVGWVFLNVGDDVIAGVLSVGDLGVMIPYFVSISVSSVRLGEAWIRLQDNAAGLNRVFWLMDQPSEQDPPGAATLPRVSGSVQVENVSFAYDADPSHDVLHDVSFEARKGELTAFVGPAGAGKTTLAFMIPRFVTPRSGRVLIDGTDISKVTRSSLRSQIAFVFQETTLFDMTIADNLRLGNPTASEADLVRAAQTAGIHDFIQSLPEGFQTRLGRAGGKLSVGQKQRLSIARALVCDAPIMIFDEPTSALDPATEARIAQALEAASRDRIVIVIAHRLSTVRNAAQILFLQDGRVVERGSHRALLANPNGAYRRFVQLQTNGLSNGAGTASS
jgi:ABC-type multidrug transport system fused ATPase/permease subunit